MRVLLCGLGFHKWRHLGYDVWKHKYEPQESWQLRHSVHQKCAHCEKRSVSYSRSGLPPEVQVNEDLTTFVDHSTPYMDPKPLLEKD